MDMSFRELKPDAPVLGLLAASGLPTDDLDGAAPVMLFGTAEGHEPSGVVGLELHGADALLRSLAVAPQARGAGTGAALVAHAEREAATRGVVTLYLLTTTAEAFFSRLGYQRLDRTEAPAGIAATHQFSGLCPASSAFMAKRLAR
jgi:amino-acid N-acetyltransferase